MATRKIGNLTVNFTPTQDQTQLYNLIGRDAGQAAVNPLQQINFGNIAGNAVQGFFDNIGRRANAIGNTLGTTAAALGPGWMDNIRENTLREQREKADKERMQNIYSNAGYNSSDDFWNEKDAAEQELFKKYGYDIDDYWNQRAKLYSPTDSNSDQLAKLDASREAIKALMTDDERNRINRLDDIERQVRDESRSQMNEANQAAKNWEDYRNNSWIGQKINQENGKFAGDALTTLSTGVDLAAMGTGLPMGVIANTAQGGIEGLANELSENGFQNFDWDRARNNMITGAVSGAATAGLNKMIPTKAATKAPGFFKSVAQGAGRGALSGAVGGAVGAGTSSALSGADIGTGLANTLSGAVQGTASGAFSGGVMGGVNNLGNKAINAIDNKYGTNLGEISRTGQKWQESGRNFNERLTNTLNSGESAVGNWINNRQQSKLLNSLGNIGNRIQDVSDGDALIGADWDSQIKNRGNQKDQPFQVFSKIKDFNQLDDLAMRYGYTDFDEAPYEMQVRMVYETGQGDNGVDYKGFLDNNPVKIGSHPEYAADSSYGNDPYQRVYSVSGTDEQYTFASNDNAPRNVKQAAVNYAYETDGRVDPAELTDFYNQTRNVPNTDVEGMAMAIQAETDGRVDANELLDFVRAQDGATYGSTKAINFKAQSETARRYLDDDVSKKPSFVYDTDYRRGYLGANPDEATANAYQRSSQFLEMAISGKGRNMSDSKLISAFDKLDPTTQQIVLDRGANYITESFMDKLADSAGFQKQGRYYSAPNSDSPTTLGGWLKKAGKRAAEDINKTNLGNRIQDVSDDEPQSLKQRALDAVNSLKGRQPAYAGGTVNATVIEGGAPDGSNLVKADYPLPANASKRSIGQAIRNVIKSRFQGKSFDVGDTGMKAAVNARTADEMSYQQSNMTDTDFNKKGSMAGNLDELLENMTDARRVANKKPDAKPNVDYYISGRVAVDVGDGEIYNPRVDVEVKNGRPVAYNISDIKKYPGSTPQGVPFGGDQPAVDYQGTYGRETIIPQNEQNGNYSDDINNMFVNRNDMLDTATESPETELYRQLTGNSGNSGSTTQTPLTAANTGDSWDNLAREYGYNTYNDAIRAFAAANPNTPISAGAVTTWLDTQEGSYNPNALRNIPEAEIVENPLEESFNNKVGTIGKRNKAQAIGAMLEKAADTQKYGGVYDSLDKGTAGRAAKTGAIQKLADLGVGSQDYNEYAKTSSYVNQVLTDLANKSNVKVNIPDLATELSADNTPGLMNADAIRKYNSYINKIVADGATPDQYSAGYLLQKSRELGNYAAKVPGYSGDADALRTALTNAKYILRDHVAEALDQSGITGPDTNALIAEGLEDMGANKAVVDYYTADGDNGKAPTVRDYISRSSLFEQGREMGSQIDAEQFTRSASKKPTKVSARLWQASGLDQPVEAILKSTVAPVASKLTKGVGKAVSAAGNLVSKIQGNGGAGTISNPQTAVYDLLNRNNTLNVIGRNIGEEMGQAAQPVQNYIQQASAESGYVAPLAATTSTYGTGGNNASSLEDLAGTGATTLGTTPTTVSDALTAAETTIANTLGGNSYNGLFSNTGNDQIDLLGRAMELAMEADDAESFAALYSMYNSALQKADNTSDLSAAQQTQMAKFDSAEDAINELESLYNEAGGGKGPIAGNLQSVAGDWGWDSGARTYNQMAEGLVNQIAQAIGKTDSLNTEGEVKRALQLVPSLTDDAQTAQNKLRTLREMLAQTKANYYGAYGVSN